ncbi:hypothetical protein [Actinoplanes sp. N902-109]|uniref:hypothetical protein n=1 Tax=Actinoplanes sp. (strain N902-109) TaxID=649831 RepID=UPI0003294052|nr:hypothetical protein [Actinoplanes sp. N902-109]AGL19053.1 hypothetical protein L083_5543 [Actinoplanes sp. N902-109]
MTDEELDRLVRDADPYRPVASAQEQQSLLDEIVAAPPARSWRTAAVLSAAAALIAVVTLPALLVSHRQQAPAPPVGFLAASAAAPSAVPSATPAPVSLLTITGDKVLLLAGSSGWKITTVYGFGADDGTVVIAKGDLSLDITWYPGARHDSYYQDRLEVSAPEPGVVDGWAGDVFTYSDSDWELLLHARSGVFAGLRTSGPWTRAGFDDMLATLQRVDPRTWLAALPAATVTPPRARAATEDLLTGVPLPPGFTVSGVDIPGVYDRYQYGAELINRIGCGWFDEWTRATRDHDTTAVARVTTALGSSHTWPVLVAMRDEGDYAEGFWDLADRVAAGKSPGDYHAGFGCP